MRKILLLLCLFPFCFVNAETLNGEYVLIINTNLDQDQSTGSFSFDNSGTRSSVAANDISAEFAKQIISEIPPKTQLRSTTTYDVGFNKMISSKNYVCIGEGEHCYIWVDDAAKTQYDAANLTQQIATDAANVYDNQSYPILKQLDTNDYLKYADGSGKMSILIESGISSTGYFSSQETYTQYGKITAIHVKTIEASDYDPNWGYDRYSGLFAHEGQHALNFYSSGWQIWINEGLSLAAMDINSKGQDANGWIGTINNDEAVANGGELVHEYYLDSHTLNYGLPFLYVRYLNTQANMGYDWQGDFYSKFYDDSRPWGDEDSDFIERILAQYPNTQDLTFTQSMINFRIAAFLQARTGEWGFYNDAVIANKLPNYPLYTGVGNLTLPPTGAIIVKTNANSFTVPASHGADIQFIPFNKTGVPNAFELEGEGTQTNPYLLSSYADLRFLYNNDYVSSHFKVVNDIDCGLVENYFSYPGPAAFTGVLDGQNHTIKNLASPLFYTNSGVVKNLNIEVDANITSYSYMVGFIAYNNSGTIEKVKISGDIKINYSATTNYTLGIGSFAGNLLNGSVLNQCVADVNITGKTMPGTQWFSSMYVGGIYGYSDYQAANILIKDSYSTGSINMQTDNIAEGGNIKIGGIGGYAYTNFDLQNSYSVMSITTNKTNQLLGRLIGESSLNYETANNYALNGLTPYGGQSSTTASRTDAQLKQQSTFVGYNFNDIWVMSAEGDYLYPMLQWQQLIPTSVNNPTVNTDIAPFYIQNQTIYITDSSIENYTLYNVAGQILAKNISASAGYYVPLSGRYLLLINGKMYKILL